MEECVVNTRFGKVIGRQSDKARIFKSIPFAVTERFEEPGAVEPWGEFDATGKNKQKNCPQRFCYVDEKAEGGFYYKEFDYMRDSDYGDSPT